MRILKQLKGLEGIRIESLLEENTIQLYRARRKNDGSHVLIKTFDPARGSALELEQLRNEYEITRNLESRVIPKPLGIEYVGGVPLLFLEDPGGSPLSRSLGMPMPLRRFLRLAIDIGEALGEIHSFSIIHKSINPKHILVPPVADPSFATRVRLTGFEISITVGQEERQVPSGRFIEGSLPYLAPEQTGRVNRPIDARADLYSLGATFFEMLTGRRPFTASDPLEWVHCHIARVPPLVTEYVPAIPAVLARMVAKLLAKSADDRYQSAGGLVADLRRALDEWEKSGSMAEFPLGKHDFLPRFQIPQRLFGRRQELEALKAALERVSGSGVSELVLVMGNSGVGKSSLVNELRVPVISASGVFAAGKFDRTRREMPYSIVIQAIEGLVAEILTGSQAQVMAWRAKILAAVGANGQLIVNMIPAVAAIIGPQEPVAELPPAEAKNRFDEVMVSFISVFAEEGHPAALFLDDLQWADAGSLELLTRLMIRRETKYLLIVGAYRQNEVSPAHPLSIAIGKIEAAGAPVRGIPVKPLPLSAIRSLVFQSVHSKSGKARSLAGLIHRKTGGNPFFAIQFLNELHHSGRIIFDHARQQWDWRLENIESAGYTDNVADLMIERLSRLPGESLELLKIAACIGDSVDIGTLSGITGRDEHRVKTGLAAAAKLGLVLNPGKSYKFPHDRIQEAAYLSIPEDQRPGFHLDLGRRWLQCLSPEAIQEKIFNLAGQFNRAGAELSSPAEKLAVAELNLLAGRRARGASAYSIGARYFAQGLAVLPPGAWDTRYRLAYDLAFGRAECEYLSGATGAEAHLLELLRLARDRVEKSSVYQVLIDLRVTKGELGEAVETALECFKLFGIHMSAHPGWNDVLEEYGRVNDLLRTRSVREIVALPLVTDPEIQAVMRALSFMFAPAYFTDNNLLCLHIFHMVRLSLLHGNTASSSNGYAWFGLILAYQFHRYRDGLQFGELARELVARPEFLSYRAKVIFAMEFISFWSRPIPEAMKYLYEAFRVAVETGDLTIACYCCNHIVTDLLMMGVPLSEVYRESEARIDYAAKAKFQDVVDIIVGSRRFILNMQGLTRDFSTFDGPGFDQAEFESRLTGSRMPTLVCWYYVAKLQARFISGDHDQALEAAAMANKMLWASFGHPQILDFHLYHALSLAADFASVSREERARRLELLAGYQERFREWAKNNPVTFSSAYRLVSAEVARVKGEEMKCMRLYEQAIESAKSAGFVQNEAIAYELASGFYRQRGFALIAESYLREARVRYRQWGAEGKVRQIDKAFPEIARETAHLPAGGLVLPTEEVDLIAIVKAARTISTEVVQENLLPTLLRVVLAQSGAQKAYLIRPGEGNLRIEAEATVGTEGLQSRLLNSLRLEESSLVPRGIVRLVERTRREVILGNAAVEASEEGGLFAADEYLSKVKPKSVYCLPILMQRELLGILYLENNAGTDLFSRQRRATLGLLASQAAISLRNADLYRERSRTLLQEHAARVEAERLVRLRDDFLSMASHELRTPLTPLRMYLDLIKWHLKSVDPRLFPNSERFLRAIESTGREIDRLAKLIENMLDVSRIGAGRIIEEIEEVDLYEVVLGTVERFRTELEKIGCEVLIGKRPQSLLGRWDKFRIEQVVANLLSNAMKFGAGRPIEFGFAVAEGFVELSVRDHGIGIKKEDQEKIFMRFERAVSVKEFGGLGLGLFITREIVLAHGGTIRVESQPGEGAVFIVRLPRISK